MGIELTPEEQQLFKEGKLDPNKVEEFRKLHPVRTININEVDAVKQEIRQAMESYQAAINKNKELYTMLVENRKAKEDCRNKVAELRLKKKQLLGLVK